MVDLPRAAAVSALRWLRPTLVVHYTGFGILFLSLSKEAQKNYDAANELFAITLQAKQLRDALVHR